MTNKKARTIDAFIKWLERCLFHADGYNAPTEKDLHVWLKHAKKFKREQDNLKVALDDIHKLLSACQDSHSERGNEIEKLVRYVKAETALRNIRNKKVKVNQLTFLSRQAHLTYQAISVEMRKIIEDK